MSILKPTMSITRFTVDGIPEVDGKDPIQAMMDAFESHQIGEIEMGEDVTWGWTSLLDVYCPMFKDVSFMTGDYVTVGLRIDKKSIPAAVIKKEVYLAEKQFLYDNQLPKLARAQKIIIKESVIKNLLEKAPAVPVSYDIVWNVQEEVLYLFTTNKLAKDVLEDVMLESFGLQIQMIFPFTMGLNDVDESVLSTIQPTSFV